jgi:hypothetical protein
MNGSRYEAAATQHDQRVSRSQCLAMDRELLICESLARMRTTVASSSVGACQIPGVKANALGEAAAPQAASPVGRGIGELAKPLATLRKTLIPHETCMGNWGIRRIIVGIQTVTNSPGVHLGDWGICVGTGGVLRSSGCILLLCGTE